MAKRVAGVTEKLMECAKEEFLANGYENASLRIIAEKAGSSKGAIYIRYPIKKAYIGPWFNRRRMAFVNCYNPYYPGLPRCQVMSRHSKCFDIPMMVFLK